MVFDQGGNDLGSYKLEWLQSGDQNYSGPVAVCQPFLQKTLIGSEPVKITIAEIDLGSYDPCGSFKLEVSKSTFSCLDLGEQDITLTIRNEAGRTNTCKTRVTITSDLEVDFPSCLQVFPAYAPAACAKISPEVSGGAPTYGYLWNDLSKDEVLAVCPGTSTPYLVTVTDARGCSTSAQVMVEAIDISCGNNKVYLCQPQQRLLGRCQLPARNQRLPGSAGFLRVLPASGSTQFVTGQTTSLGQYLDGTLAVECTNPSGRSARAVTPLTVTGAFSVDCPMPSHTVSTTLSQAPTALPNGSFEMRANLSNPQSANLYAIARHGSHGSVNARVEGAELVLTYAPEYATVGGQIQVSDNIGAAVSNGSHAVQSGYNITVQLAVFGNGFE